MAPLTIRSRAKLTSFICDSCLDTLRPLRGSASTPVRHLSTSASADNTPPSSRSATNPHSTSSRANIRRAPRAIRSLQSHRRYTTDLSPAPYPQLAKRGLAPLPHRRLVSLSGPDAAKFLQGLITNNVETSKTSFYCAFLNARGRVLWDAFIWVFPGKEWSCYIEVDGDEADMLLKHLKRHKLRSKITVSMVPENEVGIWAAWGFEQSALQDESLILSLPDPRAPYFGTRCLFQGNQGGDGVKANPPFPVIDTQQYHIRRYLHGIPEGPKEIQRESALPMEFNFDLSEGIDFRKGCYVGQELTIRTKHTGVVRKRVLPVQLSLQETGVNQVSVEDPKLSFDPSTTLAETLQTGLDIKPLPGYADPNRVRATGKFLVGIGNVGLALCRLEMMTDMRVGNEGVTFNPSAVFIVKDGIESQEAVRIKAIVPTWFRERERAVWSKGRRATKASEVD